MARFDEAPMRVRQLSEMLRYGGAFTSPERTEFCAPYWWALRPRMSDLPAHLRGDRLPWAVIKPETVVRAKPASDAPVLHSLALELVRVLDDAPADAERRFVAVQLGELRGFVERAALRNLADETHACFEHASDDSTDVYVVRGERWRLTRIVY